MQTVFELFSILLRTLPHRSTKSVHDLMLGSLRDTLCVGMKIRVFLKIYHSIINKEL